MAGERTNRERRERVDDLIHYVAAQVSANHGRPLTADQEARARALCCGNSGRAGPRDPVMLNSFSYLTLLAVHDSAVRRVEQRFNGGIYEYEQA